MSEAKKSRKIRMGLFLLAFFAAVGFSYYRLSGAFVGYCKAQIETQLPRMRESHGLAINYGSVDFGLLSGPRIRDVSITSSRPGDLSYVIRVPEIAIDYSIQYRPVFKVSLRAVELRNPSISVVSKYSVIEERLKGVTDDSEGGAEGGAEGSVQESHAIRQMMNLKWIDGRMNLLMNEGEGDDPLFQLKLIGMDGLAKYDPQTGNFVVENLATVDGGGGYFGFMAVREKYGTDISLFLKKIKLNSVSKYFPEYIKTNGNAYVDAQIKGKSLKDIPAKPISVDIQFKNLTLQDESISDRSIKGIDFNVGGDLAWNIQDKEVEIDKLKFGIKKLSLGVTGVVDYKEKPKIDGVISIGDTPIQSILDSIPGDFIPLIRGAKVAGTLDYEMEFSLDFNKLSALKLEPRIDIKNYKLLKSSKDVDIEMLDSEFKHVVRLNGDSAKHITVGRSSKKFVPFKDLGEYTIKGVLTCEDGSFFYHNGFQLKHIRESIIQNIRDKQFTRGASTITMQLAKNLFLTGKKNLSRKFQEMLIAYALEQALDKKRLIEIYMNIIEWGPDLYGIGPAAQHYFDKDPEELTALESAYLGSVIASPRRYHYMYKNGYVSDQWITYLTVIMGKMNISVEEYEDARPFEPEFGWVRKDREAREALEAQNDNPNL
ncbi:MAG: transglycosylase domain-containing protein [Deltaproteobacteria bacterium]|jgi:hypothetical protein|nr:transglycosylase domain-containing protein [Deltaproteobacteria bacterium]